MGIIFNTGILFPCFHNPRNSHPALLDCSHQHDAGMLGNRNNGFSDAGGYAFSHKFPARQRNDLDHPGFLG
jgi:hypothetical protein